MLDHTPASPSPNWRRLLALSCLSALVLGANQAGALPRIQVGPAPGFLLVQGGPPDPEQGTQENRQAPIGDLNEVLEATRAKFEELDATVIAAAVTEQRKQLQTLKQENERLAAEVQQANAHRTELESSSEVAEARIAELSKALDVAVREAARIDDELAGLRRQNAQLNESLARARTAREAAQAEAEKTRAGMEAKLGAAEDAAEQSRAELAERREELEATRQQLATANRERERSVARVSAVEEVLERSGAEAERSKTELAAAKEQLGQAASAALEAVRARQVASSKADSLRDEAARAREELAAARIEIERFKTANTELEKQIASWDRDSRSAIEAARYNLILMEEKIDELKAVLGVGRPEKAAPALRPRAKRDPAEDEQSAETHAPSLKAQAPAPEPARKIGADHPSGGRTKLSDTELSKWRAYVIDR
jgi:DNA repair exonuclease SbcCD ATPase subunit